jgi:hypothetical protein
VDYSASPRHLLSHGGGRGCSWLAMGLEFLPICDVLFNVVSLASYFCDVVFDIITTYTFHTTGHVVWFCLSLISICVSLLACQVRRADVQLFVYLFSEGHKWTKLLYFPACS